LKSTKIFSANSPVMKPFKCCFLFSTTRTRFSACLES
jgi:hypothetical protein